MIALSLSYSKRCHNILLQIVISINNSKSDSMVSLDDFGKKHKKEYEWKLAWLRCLFVFSALLGPCNLHYSYDADTGSCFYSGFTEKSNYHEVNPYYIFVKVNRNFVSTFCNFPIHVFIQFSFVITWSTGIFFYSIQYLYFPGILKNFFLSIY